MPEIDVELKEVVALSGRDFHAKGLTWGRDAGDTSLFDPETGYVYILPMPTKQIQIPDWSTIEAQHVAVVDLDGRNVGDQEVPPTVELHTHLHVYRARPEIRAIVHSHGRWSRVFAALRKPIPSLMMDQLHYVGGEQIQCAVIGAPGSERAAASLVECLGAHGKSALLAAHGAVCLGESMEEAMSVAEITEDMARVAVFASMLGEPPEVTLADLVGEEGIRDLLAKQAL
jgi:L-fuculose-phosphate aldolase